MYQKKFLYIFFLCLCLSIYFIFIFYSNDFVYSTLFFHDNISNLDIPNDLTEQVSEKDTNNLNQEQNNDSIKQKKRWIFFYWFMVLLLSGICIFSIIGLIVEIFFVADDSDISSDSEESQVFQSIDNTLSDKSKEQISQDIIDSYDKVEELLEAYSNYRKDDK